MVREETSSLPGHNSISVVQGQLGYWPLRASVHFLWFAGTDELSEVSEDLPADRNPWFPEIKPLPLRSEARTVPSV